MLPPTNEADEAELSENDAELSLDSDTTESEKDAELSLESETAEAEKDAELSLESETTESEKEAELSLESETVEAEKDVEEQDVAALSIIDKRETPLPKTSRITTSEPSSVTSGFGSMYLWFAASYFTQ